MVALLKLIWASYQHNVSRVALVFIALITACAGLSAVLVINSAAKSSYAAAGQPFLQQVEQRITARSGHSLSKQDFTSLRRMGFTQLIPVLRSSQNVIHPQTGETQRLSLLGIDAFSIFSYSARNASQAAPNTADIAAQDLSQLWTAPFASVIHPDFASELNFVSGQVFSVDNKQLLPQLAITDIDGLGREVVMDIGQLQRVLGTQNISELLIIGDEEQEKKNEAISALKAVLPEHLQLENINTGEQAQQLTGSFHLNLLAMACLMFVVCMFVVMNALHLLIMKRWQNLRIARQLGVSRNQIYWAQGTELILISLLCAPLGAIAGVFLAQLASPMVSLTLQSLFDVRVSYTQVAYATLLLQCFVACILGAVAAAALPMWQLDTKLALRNLPVSTDSSHLSWLYTSIVLGCAAVSLGYYSTGMLMSFGAIAMSIFAGCSLLIYAVPKSLNTLFHSLPQRWVLFRWLAADGVRLSQKSKIACCAFFIALTSNIGMNLMVDSFRQATHQWLTQRLVADQYVSTQTPKVFTQWLATQDINAGLGVNVIERKGIDAFLLDESQSQVSEQTKNRTGEPISNRINKPTKIELRSYPSTELYQAAMLFAEQQADVWQIFSTGQGVLVNQQLALRHGLVLGEILSFYTEAGQPESKQIVGIYYDYGNQNAQAMLDLDYFSKYKTNTTLFALHFDSEQQQSLFTNQLASSSISSQVSSIQTRELLALSMKTFERTFVITDGLNIVTLLVAALSLATSVLMIDMDNRPQRALLRSMGVGNYQITGLSLVQYTLLSLLACLVALPFGIGLTWLLINLINVQAFSWSYPILITPSKLFSAGIMSTLLIVVVVAIPLYKLSRRKLVEDIKCLSF
jgi:putative ABC transport system permease protein